jgi:tetratricopeptide (TPR) repeat protein
LGAAQLRAWDLIQNPDVLSDASDTFNMVRRLNPDYPRSYLGLGDVAWAESQILNADGTGIGSINKDKLDEAIQWYKAGLVVEQPAQAYIPVKSAFGLGQAYLLGYEFHVIDNSREPAQQFFQQVIESHQAEKNTGDLVWFAAHAHAGLGRLAALDQDWNTMSEEYRKAVTIWDDSQRIFPNTKPTNIWIARFWSNAAFAEEKLAHPDKAREYYELAIKIGKGVVGSEELANWQSALDRLKKGSP